MPHIRKEKVGKIKKTKGCSSNRIQTRIIRSPSSILSHLSEDYDFRLPTLTTTTTQPTITTTTSNSLPLSCSMTSINETSSMEDKMTNSDVSIITQQPLPSNLSLSISTTPKTSINSSVLRTVITSTTTADTLNRIKYLKSLRKSKNDEIDELEKEIKKLKDEIKKYAEFSICI